MAKATAIVQMRRRPSIRPWCSTYPWFLISTYNQRIVKFNLFTKKWQNKIFKSALYLDIATGSRKCTITKIMYSTKSEPYFKMQTFIFVKILLISTNDVKNSNIYMLYLKLTGIWANLTEQLFKKCSLKSCNISMH